MPRGSRVPLASRHRRRGRRRRVRQLARPLGRPPVVAAGLGGSTSGSPCSTAGSVAGAPTTAPSSRASRTPCAPATLTVSLDDAFWAERDEVDAIVAGEADAALVCALSVERLPRRDRAPRRVAATSPAASASRSRRWSTGSRARSSAATRSDARLAAVPTDDPAAGSWCTAAAGSPRPARGSRSARRGIRMSPSTTARSTNGRPTRRHRSSRVA